MQSPPEMAGAPADVAGAAADKPVEFAQPLNVERPEDCWFYHTIELPGLGLIKGQWDLRDSIDTYFGHFDFTGKRVLDLGAASGYLTFEMEKRGASVVSFDMGENEEWDVVPFDTDEQRAKDAVACQTGVVARMRASYWLAHRLLGSQAKAYYGNVYRLPRGLGKFDAVMIGQILVHLRDPFAALASACRLSADAVIVTENTLDTPEPLAFLIPNVGERDANHQWWIYSLALYERVFGILGFELTRVEVGSHRCTVEGIGPMITLTTMVARRRGLPGVTPWRDQQASIEQVPGFTIWRKASGLGAIEGPYPQWNLPLIRWGYGPSTTLDITRSSATGGRYKFVFSGQCWIPDQKMVVKLDGRAVGEFQFLPPGTFCDYSLPLELSAGPHELVLEYSKWESPPASPTVHLAVKFRKLQIVPE